MSYLPGMKVDYLVLDFFFMDSGEFGHYPRSLDPLLDLIERNGGEFTPQYVYYGRRRTRYSRANVRKHLDDANAKRRLAWVSIGRDEPDVAYHLKFSQEGALTVQLEVRPLSVFAEGEGGDARIDILLKVVRALASYVPFTFGSAHSITDEYIRWPPDWLEKKVFDPTRMPQAHWLMVLGKKFVDAYGEAHMLAAPAAHRERLANGTFLFLTSRSPADFMSDTSRVAQARFLAHFRRDLSFDTVLASLREQSAALRPIEAHFDPDMVPLLMRHLWRVDDIKKRQEIERLNTWRPAPVTEWMPLKDAPVANEEDPAKALHFIELEERYLLEKVIPKKESPDGVMGPGLAGVNAFEVFLFEHDYMDFMPRAKMTDVLIPAVGSHLGQLLVRDLGGRWVLRSNPEESYVALGDRAFFPHERAKRFMPTRETMLEHPLSKFYAEAMRYAQSFHAKA